MREVDLACLAKSAVLNAARDLSDYPAVIPAFAGMTIRL
jgi:hypothetical protein